MNPNYRKRGYRANRPSKTERSKLWNFSKAVFSKDQKELTTKSKKPAKKQQSGIVYTDKDGNQQSIAASDVKSYADTEYFADSSGIFRQLGDDRQAFFGKMANVYDEDGRPSLTDRTIIVREVIQMTKGQYGPYYAMHVISAGEEGDDFAGEFSVLSRGSVVADTLENLSGISLETGKRIAPGELPVALTVRFAANEGDFDGYFYVTPPAEPADAEAV